MGRGPCHAESYGDRVSGDWNSDTRIVQAGRRKEWCGKLVNPPVHPSMTTNACSSTRRASMIP